MRLKYPFKLVIKHGSFFLFTVTFTRLSEIITIALLYLYTDSQTSHSNIFRPLIDHLQVYLSAVLFTQTAPPAATHMLGYVRSGTSPSVCHLLEN